MTDQGKLLDFLNYHDPSPINIYTVSFVSLVVAATVIPLHTQKKKFLAKRNYWFFIGEGDTRYKIVLNLNQIRNIINKKDPDERLLEFKKITGNSNFRRNLIWTKVSSFVNEEDVFNNADTNSDGNISPEELQATLAPPPSEEVATQEPLKDLCNVNERVSANNCIPCDTINGVLLTRPAGDNPNPPDPSGNAADTVCERLEIVILNSASKNNFNSSNMMYVYKDHNEWWLLEYYLFIMGILASLFIYRVGIKYITNLFYLTDHNTPITNIGDYLSVVVLGFLLYYLDEDYRDSSEDAIHSNKYWQYLYILILILLTLGPSFRHISDFNITPIGTIKSVFKSHSMILSISALAMLVIIGQQIYIFKPAILPGNSESFKLSPSLIQDTQEEKSIQDLIDEQTRSN